MAEYIKREALPNKRERGFFLDDDFNAGWNACLHEIEKIPAANVRENVKSAWVRCDKHIVKCHKCGNFLDMRGVNAGRGDANFCPNCGAKMEVQDG